MGQGASQASAKYVSNDMVADHESLRESHQLEQGPARLRSKSMRVVLRSALNEQMRDAGKPKGITVDLKAVNGQIENRRKNQDVKNIARILATHGAKEKQSCLLAAEPPARNLDRLAQKFVQMQNEKKLQLVERRMRKSEWMQKQVAMREVRKQERRAWIESLDLKTPRKTAESIVDLFKSHPLQNTLRENELIPGFQPQHSDTLIQELRHRQAMVSRYQAATPIPKV